MKPGNTPILKDISGKLVKMQKDLDYIKQETFSKKKTILLAEGYACLGMSLALMLSLVSLFKDSSIMTLVYLGAAILLFLVATVCISKAQN